MRLGPQGDRGAKPAPFYESVEANIPAASYCGMACPAGTCKTLTIFHDGSHGLSPGTDGSNPLPSSGESGANSSQVHEVAERFRTFEELGYTDVLVRHLSNWAHSQGALSWELRCATSLARLRRDRARSEEAHELLAPVYDRFTEGFATVDLRVARALLDKLP
jgi:hypothetical protein